MTPRARLAALVVSALLASSCGGDGQARSSHSPTTAASTSASNDVVLPTEHYVDVGEVKMYMLCWNEPVPGEPSILLMSGADLLTSSWENMAYALAPEGHHICAYDRLGVGNSDPPVEASRTTADQVDELVGLLDSADLEQPVVIAAHSIAGLLAVALVDQASERVAGVVLVDPLPPRLSIVQRAALPPMKRHESAVLTDERRFLNDYLNDPAQNSERLLLGANDRYVARLLDKPGPVFGDLPLIVLQQPRRPPIEGVPSEYNRATLAAIDEGMEEYAAESTRGRLIHVNDTGHMIQDDQPEVVMDAVRDVLAE